MEADEFGHSDRNIDYKTERRKAIEKELDYKFILQLILMKKF